MPGIGPGSGRLSGDDAAELRRRPAALLLDARLVRGSPEAASVIAFADFRDEALDEHADVVFPAEVYAEKEGTVTHPDGRLQRVRQALGRPGEVRPAGRCWPSLRACGAGSTCASAADGDRAAGRGRAVLRRPHARRDRRPGACAGRTARRRRAARRRAAREPLADPPAGTRGPARWRVPTLWSGPEVEHSPSLRFLRPGAARVEPSEDAARLGVPAAVEVEHATTLEAAGGERRAPSRRVRTGVPRAASSCAAARCPDGPRGRGRKA